MCTASSHRAGTTQLNRLEIEAKWQVSEREPILELIKVGTIQPVNKTLLVRL